MPSRAEDWSWRSAGYAWWVVVVLALGLTLSLMDRLIIALMIGPIKRDFALSDTDIGLLQGLAFTLLYVIAGLPLGRIADRGSRRGLAALSVMTWSVMTMICGLTTSFHQLFIARLGVGVGEAGLSPAAISLVSDYFPPQQRARPLAFLSIGATAGAGLALMFGGAMVHAIGTSERIVLPLLGTVRGWQAVLLLLGAIGVLFSGIFLSVREPQRRERLAVPRASVAALGAALPMAAAPLLANPWWVVAVLYVGMTFLVIPSALAPAMLQSVCPNELRGQVFSVYLLVMSTFGYALGPLSVAWITDHVLHSENRLHVSLALVAASVSRPPPAVSPPHVAGTASSLRATRIPGVVHKAMPGIHVDLRQLRYFKAIADARSFVRAADHLHVAQPALSRSIAKLEEQLGRLLFIRHSGGISLTDSGVLLYQHAEHVLKGMQRLTDEMAADNQVPRGLVSMGAPPSMQSTLTAPVAARFIKAFPYAFLNVIQDTSARLREGVAAGHLDVIVVSSMAPSGGLHYSPLFTESLCLIYAATSPLHMKTHARLEDMLGIPLILCGYPDTLRLYLNQAFADSEQKPTVRCEVNSAGLVADLVAHGAGVGIAPYGSIPQQNQRGLVVIPILGLESSWMIATSFERIGSTAVQQLSTMIVDHVRHAVASGAWPTARFDGPATSDPDLQRTQLPAWQEPVEGVVATLSL